MKGKKVLIIAVSAVVILIALCVIFLMPKIFCLMNDCNGLRQSGSEYCAKHTCTLEGCNNQKSTEKAYCGDHGCLAEGCSEKLPEEFVSVYFYCPDHKCKVDKCNNQESSYGHCLQHLCARCGEPVQEYYALCSDCAE